MYLCEKITLTGKRPFPKTPQTQNFFMEKETLIQELKNKSGETGLSDKTFEDVANAILPNFADDTKITDDSWTLPVAMLKTAGGQLRHEQAEWIKSKQTTFETDKNAAIEAAKKLWEEEWKKSHPETQPEKEGEPTADVRKLIAEEMAKLTGADGAIGKLSATMQNFLDGAKKREEAEKIGQIKKELREYLVGKNATKDAVIDLAIEKLEVGDKPVLTELKAKVEADYEKLYKQFYGDGSLPFNGDGGGGEDNGKAMKEYLKRKHAELEEATKRQQALKASLK